MIKPQTYALPDQMAAPVGERLKAIRLEKSLTLTEVAELTSVSTSNLSKIERGDVSPSFDVVMKICHGLGVAIEQFVKPGPKASVSGRKTVTLSGMGVTFSSPQYLYEAHSIEIYHKNMIPWKCGSRPVLPTISKSGASTTARNSFT